MASRYFNQQYPRARITAYEADPDLAAMVDANLKTNWAADAEIVHAALWTSNGQVTFRCERSDSDMIASLPGAVDARSTVVRSLRLRAVLEAESIHLLKLDIEGAEDLVWRTASLCCIASRRWICTNSIRPSGRHPACSSS